MSGRVGPARARVRPETVAQLAEDGYGRNAIARKLGVSSRAVDTAALEAGVTFDRARTRKATRAVLADHHDEQAREATEIAATASQRLKAELERDDLDPQVIRALSQALEAAGRSALSLSDRVGVDDPAADGQGRPSRWALALEAVRIAPPLDPGDHAGTTTERNTNHE